MTVDALSSSSSFESFLSSFFSESFLSSFFFDSVLASSGSFSTDWLPGSLGPTAIAETAPPAGLPVFETLLGALGPLEADRFKLRVLLGLFGSRSASCKKNIF